MDSDAERWPMTEEEATGGEKPRDPRMDPRAGDTLIKWHRAFYVLRVNQGCIFVQPSLSAHKEWVGLLFYREWAKDAEVAHVDMGEPTVPLTDTKEEYTS
jgi:hypothetical protein